ncbi:MAG: hypothetical protein PHY15_07665 [Eubacteriales bacterium]|nr:hypothetical protein [Eubacteriales bacterium]
MKSVCCLLIVLLFFISACSNPTINSLPDISEESLVETTSTPHKFDVSSSISDVNSKFSTSEWPKKPIITYEESGGEYYYAEGIFDDRFWTPGAVTFFDIDQPSKENPIIKNKEIAVSIASAIFYTQELIDNWESEDFLVNYAFFDKQDEVWIVNFSEPFLGYAPGTVTIILRKDDAQVVAFWAEAG